MSQYGDNASVTGSLIVDGDIDLGSGDDNVDMDAGTLYVDAANNRVGIGTETPKVSLDAFYMGGLILGQTILNNGGAGTYAEYDVTTSMAVPTNRWNVVFVAPANGKAEIQFQGYCDSDTSSGYDFVYLGLSSTESWSSLGNAYTKRVIVPTTSTSTHRIVTHSWYLTGLTAGTGYTIHVGTAGRTASHTWKWGGSNDSQYPDLFIRAVSLPNSIQVD